MPKQRKRRKINIIDEDESVSVPTKSQPKAEDTTKKSKQIECDKDSSNSRDEITNESRQNVQHQQQQKPKKISNKLFTQRNREKNQLTTKIKNNELAAMSHSDFLRDIKDSITSLSKIVDSDMDVIHDIKNAMKDEEQVESIVQAISSYESRVSVAAYHLDKIAKRLALEKPVIDKVVDEYRNIKESVATFHRSMVEYINQQELFTKLMPTSSPVTTTTTTQSEVITSDSPNDTILQGENSDDKGEIFPIMSGHSIQRLKVTNSIMDVDRYDAINFEITNKATKKNKQPKVKGVTQQIPSDPTKAKRGRKKKSEKMKA